MKKTLIAILTLTLILLALTGCSKPAVCGNSIIESSEQCDNSPCQAGSTCENCQCQSIPPLPTLPEE